MGGSQSTTSTRAAKFSGNGNRRSVRAVRSAPATELNARRATSCRNTNRNVKEFSKFWSDAGSVNRSKSSTRQSVKQRNGATGNGSIRRNRTQSVDVRRTSNVLPVPGTPSNSSSPRPMQRKATSFRSNGSAASSSLAVNGEGRKSRKGSTTDLLTPNSARSEVYSVEFNQAAIAAARLKRLSLTPYPDSHSPRRSNSTKKSTSSTTSSTSTLTTSSKNLTPNHPRPSSQHSHRNSYQNSPETAIY
ncbi:hypothetical protein CAEBREN_25412 [Caenorhabditis brenneri]|uniref:Uncharacterized protein n=1 Tax=Caenorhabditis brenneri TaxID=135651 RepID=G0N016_CAEBE|nr:hypothetical protein CAEBREN_25412 [Caenorhabditis brenneri]